VATKADTPFQIDTTPSKRVIVESLTRDISVDACIFDLIDNAIDAARNTIFAADDTGSAAQQLPDSYKGFEIKLFLETDSFSIQDNCGGISLEALRKSVLRFGERSSHPLGIGVFGIGLNRALFKIGRVAQIFTDTGNNRAELTLDTAKYLKSKGWNLPAVATTSTGKAGTVIKITSLPTDIARRFADKGEIDELREEIGRIYSRFIGKKLKIFVNKVAVKGQEVEIREDGPYAPDRKFYKAEDGVSIYINSGQHIKHRFGAETDYDKDVNSELTNEFGWTILCNDRVVLSEDRTSKTGWYGKFHTEFYGFVGTVSFVGDPSLLPWTTTKADVDLNNAAYQSALQDMQRFAQKWRSNANDAKKKKRRNETLNPAPKPPAAKPARKDAASGQTAIIIKKKTIKKVDHHELATILPADVDERYCNDKHLALVHEAKELILGNFIYAGLVLVRVLFETTVVTYLVRHNAFDEFNEYVKTERAKANKSNDSPEKDNPSMLPSLDEAIAYLVNNVGIFGGGKKQYLKHSLSRMQHHKKLLNSAAHNAYQPINRSEALQIRDEVLPILRHLIES